MSIFHIAHVEDWRAAQLAGAYTVSTRDASLGEVGYIHASKDRDQVERVAAFVYLDDPDPLCVLVIDDARAEAAGATIRFEDGGDGELFPHVYGAIDTHWVIDVRPAAFTTPGVFA